MKAALLIFLLGATNAKRLFMKHRLLLLAMVSLLYASTAHAQLTVYFGLTQTNGVFYGNAAGLTNIPGSGLQSPLNVSTMNVGMLTATNTYLTNGFYWHTNATTGQWGYWDTNGVHMESNFLSGVWWWRGPTNSMSGVAATTNSQTSAVDGSTTNSGPIKASAFYGSGTGLTAIPVTGIQTNIAGNPSSANYLRGDGSWATPAGGSIPVGVALTNATTANSNGVMAARLGGTIWVDTTPSNNITTGETLLWTNTLPANLLTNQWDRLTIHAVGAITNSGNAKTVSLYLGGVQIFTTGSHSFASVYTSWTLDAEIIRGASANSEYVNATFVNAASIYSGEGIYAADLSTPLGVKITGTGGATGEVTYRTSTGGLWPRP